MSETPEQAATKAWLAICAMIEHGHCPPEKCTWVCELVRDLRDAETPTPLQLRTAANGPWEPTVAEWGKGEPGDVVRVLPNQKGK